MTETLMLAGDAYYVPDQGGAYALTHRGPVRLNGASLCQWLDRLAPFLDGSHTLDDLTSAVPADRRAVVENLVTVLIEQGLITVGTAHSPTHRGTTAVFGDYPDFNAPAFNATLRAVALATGKVRAVQLGSPAADEEDTDALDGCTTAILVQSHPTVERARQVEQLCRNRDIVLVQAIVLGDEAWISGPGAPSWTAAWLRRRDRRPTTGSNVTSGAFTVLANHLAHLVSAERTDTATQFAVMSLDSLRKTEHDVLSHPFDHPAAAESELEFLARVKKLSEAEAMSADEFSERAVVVVDRAFGLLDELTEGHYAQVPVRVARTEVADPVGLLGRRPVVTGAGPDFASARYQATLNGLTAYGSLMVDPRRLLTADGAPLIAAHDTAAHNTGADPRTALAALRENAHQGWVHGYSLLDGSVRLVEVRKVFPVLSDDAEQLSVPRGAAAGYSWTEAVQAGLLGYCRRLIAAEATEATALRQVNLATADLDDTGLRYLGLLGALTEPVTVYDLTDLLDIPAFAFCLGSATVTYECGGSRVEALRAGLLSVLLHHQAHVNGQPEYAPTRYPPLADQQASGESPTCSRRALTIHELASRLEDRGHHPVAVPLDHDPELHRVLPNIVSVVML
jgi:hypothetical protein